jgi:ABC-type transport system substrate-binding protein
MVALMVVALSGLWAFSAFAASKPKYDPQGVVKAGVDMNATGGFRLDPIAMTSPASAALAYPVLWSLLSHNQDGSYSPGLAEKISADDPSAIVVTLRKNLLFSDGKVLDATAAANTINRNLKAQNAAFRLPQLNLINTVTVDSPTQFTIALKTPAAGAFYPLLADFETAPVSPTSIASNDRTSTTVIAAGPFKVESFTVGTGFKLVKNANFYDAGKVKLAGVEVNHLATGPGTVANALRAGAIDYAAVVPFADQAALTKPITLLQNVTDAPMYSNFCITPTSPLANVKVRQALNYATDRDELNERVYQGASKPMWTIWPDDVPQGNKALNNLFPYKPNKAKQLLAEAGYPNGLTLKAVSATQGDAATTDQVLQAQWAKVGVTLNLIPTNNFVLDWVTNRSGDIFTTTLIRENMQRVTNFFTKDARINSCQFLDPRIDSLTAELSALAPDDPEAKKLWQQMDELISKELVFGVPLMNVVFTFAYNADRVGGMKLRTDQILQWQPDWASIYIKKSA